MSHRKRWIFLKLSAAMISNTFIFYHQRFKGSSGRPDVILQQASIESNIFLDKRCLSHTFPRAVQSVTQTERVHLSLLICTGPFSLRLRPSCKAAVADSCLLSRCHGLFPLSVCFDVSVERDQWVSHRDSVSRPTSDITTHIAPSSWSFCCMSDQFKLCHCESVARVTYHIIRITVARAFLYS